MGLTNSQKAIWQRARSLSNSEQAIPLSDAMCAYLVARIASDLNISSVISEIDVEAVRDLYAQGSALDHQIPNVPALDLFERLVQANSDADTYFACLAALLKARLKYERILATQPLPTFEQVGPRGLLQFGQLPNDALAGLLVWRKWFFDLDNRAGQETGYLFEPIIAHALGGTPAPASKSPIRRHTDSKKGRQVDCVLERKGHRGKVQRFAYEIKMRVTIAASGQGRWQEELSFPVDCRMSGYTPVLVCFDGTKNYKLAELIDRFTSEGGECYVGEDAWTHLDSVAGPTMARFIDLYVKRPMKELLAESSKPPGRLVASWSEKTVSLSVGGREMTIERHSIPDSESAEPEIPEDLLDEDNL